MLRLFALLLLLLFGAVAVLACTPTLSARAWAAYRNDNDPYPPFEIAPRLEYVGSSGVAVYALRTSEGVILIDGGYADTAPMVLESLRERGINPRDVRIILNTHEHFDHAAGIAALQDATGARVYASPLGADVLEAGGHNDFSFVIRNFFEFDRVENVHRLRDGEQITLGDVTVTAHFTPGHTRGCTSYSFPVTIAGETRQALLICSLARLPLYRLGDDYEGIEADAARSIAKLRSLPCEVFLEVHGHNFDLDARRDLLPTNSAAFVNPDRCVGYLDDRAREWGVDAP